eukprot:2084767-Rhodomonas_salina.2
MAPCKTKCQCQSKMWKSPGICLHMPKPEYTLGAPGVCWQILKIPNLVHQLLPVVDLTPVLSLCLSSLCALMRVSGSVSTLLCLLGLFSSTCCSVSCLACLSHQLLTALLL